MAIIVECPSCGKTYNELACDKCPHCGYVKTRDADDDTDDYQNRSKPTAIIPEKSGWHTFATIMIILGGVAVAISFILALSDEDEWTLFFIVLGSYLVELGFWAIVQLLADIKLRIDMLLAKE